MSWEATEDRVARRADHTALFCRTLAELCRAEIPLPRALRLASAEVPKKDAEAVAVAVESGTSLAAALARTPSVLAAPYRKVLEAAERAGDVPGALTAIAENAADESDAGRRIRRSVAYPLGTGLIVLLIGALTVALLSPTLFGYTETLAGTSPLGLVAAALGILTLVTGTGFYLGWVKSGPRGARTLGLPFTGRIRRGAVRARTASLLALLVRQEVPLPEALALTSEATAQPHARKALAEMSQAAAAGEGLSAALAHGALFDASVLWLLETGESNGTAAEALDDIARLYRGRVDRAVDRFSVLVRPAVELTIGACVFAMAYAFLVPIYQHVTRLLAI